MLARTELYLIETDEVIDYHLPTTPDIKLMGGVETHPAKPLTEELKSFMDSASHGVVIVTFGTLIKQAHGNLMKKIMEK